MYFQNYGLQKTWLDKCLKKCFRGTFSNQHGKLLIAEGSSDILLTRS